MKINSAEKELCSYLQYLPKKYKYRYSPAASHDLIRNLFWYLAGANEQYLSFFFPQKPPSDPSVVWSLKAAQGAVDGSEYTAAAKGRRCGHIFKSGEATYQCKTCSIDDTCVLCSKCYDASDHENHAVFVSVSIGNSGCCDCGDSEAWIKDVYCTIHSTDLGELAKRAESPGETQHLPEDLVENIRSTIARALDYLCDVFSCSPEQLRISKTANSVRDDEKSSRLSSKWYGKLASEEEDEEFALILWNDEKHTVIDVQDQVARACKMRKQATLEIAHQVHDNGRCIIMFSKNIQELIRMAQVIEQIKLTVTIRSARDTFREQMCETIIEWISDIAGCSTGGNHDILRKTICEEMLAMWRIGSEGSNVIIGRDGLDDHQIDEVRQERLVAGSLSTGDNIMIEMGADRMIGDDSDDNDDSYGEFVDGNGNGDDEMDLDSDTRDDGDGDLEMSAADLDDFTGAAEATYAGYPPPPPPPPPPPSSFPDTTDHGRSGLGAQSSRTSQADLSAAASILAVPPTPEVKVRPSKLARAPKHWLEKPAGYIRSSTTPLAEDLWQRVRLDYLILYDLRMWKKLRGELRDLYVSTVVTIPDFKRLLGLRFAGLYTPLAQLYLIADREPDHSIIMLSVQMLTTPSITAEIVERGNFLTRLMAILYTFLTTRQVGYPSDVSLAQSLAFESGAVTNRRMYHFFQDLKYLLGSDWVKDRLCIDGCYLLQFLDLVRLHQGICPNIRQISEHIEYETDAWIHASLITREINKLCRQFSEAFTYPRIRDNSIIADAIRRTALITTRNSIGCDRNRFPQSEIKEEVSFEELDTFEFDVNTDHTAATKPRYLVVDFDIQKGPLSFHHALHYTLSWLIERGKSMPVSELRELLKFTHAELTENSSSKRNASLSLFEPDQYLLALFDYPLRVCAWLMHMRAGLWVRNGLTLRHQMTTYRGYAQRDMSYQRDIFMLQVAMVTCDPSVFLASMIHRFGLLSWAKGLYHIRPGFVDQQILEVAEDFIHLLIVLLSDRTALLTAEDEPNPHVLQCKREIIHILCFKPMSYSELTNRISDRVLDLQEFSIVLAELTVFRAPEGLADSGTFELKPRYIEDIDPYIAFYSRNQREDAESVYKKHMAKKTGKTPSDVVFVPKLRAIRTGLFCGLRHFTQTPIFAQIIFYFLNYVFVAKECDPTVPSTRIEIYVQFVLQLAILATDEDVLDETEVDQCSPRSFVYFALCRTTSKTVNAHGTIFEVLNRFLNDPSLRETFKPSFPKVKHILQNFQVKQPNRYSIALQSISGQDHKPDDALMNIATDDKESKKKLARERQARIMEEFKKSQNIFEEKNVIDWGEDDMGEVEDSPNTTTKEETVWKFPSGTCILCQEETDDRKIYGTFGYVSDSNILRQTPKDDIDYIEELSNIPESLDRSAESLRPFGVAQQNRYQTSKILTTGERVSVARQDLGKGFPARYSRRGPVVVGCGHITHFSCLEVYIQATQRRHNTQITRNHPERLELNEFLCPLCKALGNMFLPILWKARPQRKWQDFAPQCNFDTWINTQLGIQISRFDKSPERPEIENLGSASRYRVDFTDYVKANFISPLASKLTELSNIEISQVSASLTSQIPNRLTNLFAPYLTQGEARDQTPSISESRNASSQVLPHEELLVVYQRLRATMGLNGFPTAHTYPNVLQTTDFTQADSLMKALGFSISAVEIAQRGVGIRGGCTLVDNIPIQTINFLRILSETVTSYIAVGGLVNQGFTQSIKEYRHCQSQQCRQLFTGHPLIANRENPKSDIEAVDPILNKDMFIFLAESSASLIGAPLRIDIYHLVRLCYTAEILKVLMAVIHDPRLVQTSEDDSIDRIAAKEAQNSKEMFEEVTNLNSLQCSLQHIQKTVASLSPGNNRNQHDWGYGSAFLRRLSKIIYTYALTFLRKSVLLLHVRFGVEFSLTQTEETEGPEVVRLSSTLNIPSLVDTICSFNPQSSHSQPITSIIEGWIQHWVAWRHKYQVPSNSLSLLPLSHPAVFELVALPRNYDTLTDEAIRRSCPSTGKPLTDACLCLFCGQIFCSQAGCCMRDRYRGGCMQHLEVYVYLIRADKQHFLIELHRCSAPVGLFLHIRKCCILYLHLRKLAGPLQSAVTPTGSWMLAPYLDKYGETDPSLRRRLPLYLNQRRYDHLQRAVWLNHGIPSAISRRLESEVNTGGWETM